MVNLVATYIPLLYKIISTFTFFLLLLSYAFGHETRTIDKQGNIQLNNYKDINDKLPNILSKSDVVQYKKLFKKQLKGNWNEADQILEKIDNKLLLGHIYYDRFLHPNKYISKYEELEKWLKTYSHYPRVMLRRIYKLSLRKLPNDIAKPKSPIYPSYLNGYGEDKNLRFLSIEEKLSKKERLIKTKINSNLKKGKPSLALFVLNKNEHSFSSNYEFDKILGDISLSFYAHGKTEESYKTIKIAASRSGSKDAWLSWRAGLAAYRIGKSNRALGYFTQCSLAEGLEREWEKAACAYWASRIYDENGNKNKSLKFLKLASTSSRSMYGHLAREKLQISEPYQWKPFRRAKNEVTNMLKYKELSRALALTEIGLYGEADLEIRHLYGKLKGKQAKALLFLAEEMDLPAVQIRIGSKLSSNLEPVMRGLYPAPNWNHEKRLSLDKALVFALIRKESAFYQKAKSSRGARGLMQLMPRTASRIEGDRRLRGIDIRRLYSPELNIYIGQKFIKKLFDSKNINSSIIHTLVAYNAGPSRMKGWMKKLNITQDPLLFIESLPSAETRWFVKYVLTDMWIYRDRFRQEKPTRKMLAYDKWPKYKNIDIGISADARY